MGALQATSDAVDGAEVAGRREARLRCLSPHEVAESLSSPSSRAVALEHVTTCATCRSVADRVAASALRIDWETKSLLATLSRGQPTGHDVAAEATPPTTDRDRPGLELLPRGAAVDRYLIIELLGAGGMGAVYRAYDPQLDRRIALKILRPSITAGESLATALLLDEAKAMARLSHRNVVAIYDAGSVDKHAYLAMELIEGHNMRTYLASKPTRRELIGRLIEAGRGLAAAHDAGLVHRDVKPENILIGDDGRVCVSDFGISTAETLFARQVAGTPQYMAPEAWDGVIERRADQYSFCAMVFEAVTGKPLQSSTRGPIDRSKLDQLPRGLHKVIARGLSEDPKDRYPTMHHLLDELVHEQPVRPWVAALVAGSVALGVTVAIWASGSTPDSPCASADGGIDDIYTGRDAVEIVGRFGTGAAPRVAATLSDLDRWSRRYVGEHGRVCRATHVQHLQSQSTLELRVACLRERGDAIGALVDTLREGDERALALATMTIRESGRLDRCQHSATALAGYAAPTTPEGAAAVANLRGPLAAMETLLYSGHIQRARDAGLSVLPLAESHKLLHATARIKIVLGLAHVRLGELDASIPLLRAAALDADRAGNDELRTYALTALVRAQASSGRIEDAEDTTATAAAALERAGSRATWLAGLSYSKGLLRFAQGRYEEALAGYQDAVTRFREAGEPDSIGALSAAVGVGNAFEALGRYAEAQAQYEVAVADHERLFGPTSPLLSSPLGFLGMMELAEGLGDPVPHLERALELTTGALGDDSPNVTVWRAALANAYALRGDPERARQQIERALAHRGTLPPLQEASLYQAVADIELAAGDNPAAIVAFTRSISKIEDTLGVLHPALDVSLARRGYAYAVDGKLAEAASDLRRSLALTTNEPGRPGTQLLLAQVLIELGERAEARRLLRECAAKGSESVRKQCRATTVE